MMHGPINIKFIYLVLISSYLISSISSRKPFYESTKTEKLRIDVHNITSC